MEEDKKDVALPTTDTDGTPIEWTVHRFDDKGQTDAQKQDNLQPPQQLFDPPSVRCIKPEEPSPTALKELASVWETQTKAMIERFAQTENQLRDQQPPVGQTEELKEIPESWPPWFKEMCYTFMKYGVMDKDYSDDCNFLDVPGIEMDMTVEEYIKLHGVPKDDDDEQPTTATMNQPPTESKQQQEPEEDTPPTPWLKKLCDDFILYGQTDYSTGVCLADTLPSSQLNVTLEQCRDLYRAQKQGKGVE